MKRICECGAEFDSSNGCTLCSTCISKIMTGKSKSTEGQKPKPKPKPKKKIPGLVRDVRQADKLRMSYGYYMANKISKK